MIAFKISGSHSSISETLPIRSPMGGMRTSLTKEVTIFPKAAPMMIPTAISTTLPRITNSLNSFSMVFLPSCQ